MSAENETRPSGCRYAEQLADTGEWVCSLNLCHNDDLLSCCKTCEEYDGAVRGLGDVVARATKAVGIKPCGRCQKRRERMNKMTQNLFERRSK